VLPQTVFVGQPQCCIRLKEILDQLENFWEGFVEITAGRQRARQAIQSRSAFFAASLGLLAFA
jgi:hypothetical protein